MADYYKVLGIDKNASKSDLKKAYRELSLKYHPDRQVDKSEEEQRQASKRMAEINEAYEVLMDDEKRKNYDRCGDPDGRVEFNFSNPFENFGFNINNPFEDILNKMRGGRPSYSPIKSGSNINVNIKLSLKKLYNIIGKTITIKFNRKYRCKTCNGDGALDSKVCPDCLGSGRVQHVSRNGNNTFVQQGICMTCNGTGKIHGVKKCNDCNGNGWVEKIEKTELTIEPSWVLSSGITIKISNEGNESLADGGKNGDLLITFIHDFNDVQIDSSTGDIQFVLKIPYYDMILGVKHELTLPDDTKVLVNIPSGSQIGDKLRLGGKGIKFGKNNHSSDYIVVLHPIIPSKPSDVERKKLISIKKDYEDIRKS